MIKKYIKNLKNDLHLQKLRQISEYKNQYYNQDSKYYTRKKFNNNYSNTHFLKSPFFTEKDLNYKKPFVSRRDKKERIKHIIEITKNIFLMKLSVKILKISHNVLIGLDISLIFILLDKSSVKNFVLNTFLEIFNIAIIDISYEMVPSFATFEDTMFGIL
nr:hypothetical protein [Cyanidiaceae sp.]